MKNMYLYVGMKKCINGVISDMTPEEIAALEAQATEQPEPTPTPEEEIAALKAQLTALETILLGGETDAGNEDPA